MVEQICNVLNAQMLTINCAVISTCFVSCLRFLLDFVLFVMFFFSRFDFLCKPLGQAWKLSVHNELLA